MTVQNQNVKNVYRGNGSTTEFPFTFAINADHPEYIHVYITNDGEQAVETTDFACDMDARTVTYPKPGSSAPELSATQRLTIYRKLPYTQELNLVNQGPFFSEDVEQTFDDQEMQIQQLNEEKERSLRVGLETTNFDTVIPLAAGKTFRVKDDGSGFEVTEDPAVAMRAAQDAQAAAERAQGAAEDAQEAAERAQGAAEDAQEAAETAQGKAEDAKDDAETAQGKAEDAQAAAEAIASQVDLMARALIFDNVAAMKAADIPAGMMACTKGYYAVNDNAGALYTVRAAAVGEVGNRITTISLNNGNLAERILKDRPRLIKDMSDFQWRGAVANPRDGSNKTWSIQGLAYNRKTGKLIAGIKDTFDNDQELLVIDPSDYSVEQRIQSTAFGHVNAITYCDETNEIMVVSTGSELLIFDGDTMAYKRAMEYPGDLATYFYAISYDPFYKVFVTKHNETDDQTGNVIFRYDFFDVDFNHLKTFTLLTSLTSSIGQGIVLRDGRILDFTCNHFMEIDLFSGKVYEIENYVPYEYEDCTVDSDGNFYMSASYCGMANVTYPDDRFEIRGFNVKDNLITNHPIATTLNPDLNNYWNDGTYVFDATVMGTSLVNAPPSCTNGIMIVIGANPQKTLYHPKVVRQIFFRTGDDNAIGETSYQIFERTMNWNHKGWSDWTRIATNGHLSTPGSTKVGISTSGFVANDTGWKNMPEYTAPDDGFIYYDINPGTNNARVICYHHGRLDESTYAPSGSKQTMSVPVTKGEKVICEYTNISALGRYFIAAMSEV